MRWSRSSGWVTAEDHGIGIEQPGNTSSARSLQSFPVKAEVQLLEEDSVGYLP
jgi:hypothetical protein